MKKFSFILSTITLGLFSTLLLAGNVRAGEPSLREKLIDSNVFSAVYAIDDYLTLATVPGSADEASVNDGLRALCAGAGADLERSDDGENGEVYRCTSSFTVSSVHSIEDDGSRSFLIKHAEIQPLDYRTPVVPSYSSLLEPKKGRLQGSYSNTDIYQYVYALCKKENGSPAFVVPKKYGKYVRLTKVAPADAFDYFMTSVKKKDAWYATCEGEKRFMLEKEYSYSENDRESLIFHPNRGLEGISFVSAEDAPAYREKLEAAAKGKEAMNDVKTFGLFGAAPRMVEYTGAVPVNMAGDRKHLGL